MFLTLPMTIIFLVGCERIYENGYTQEIGWWDATLDIFAGKPTLKKMKNLEKISETGDEKIDALIKVKNDAIEKQNGIIDTHNEAAKHSQENPDGGMMTLIGLAMSAGGIGWARTFLNKRNIEALRTKEGAKTVVLQSMYQGVKEKFRDKEVILNEIKDAAADGAKVANDNMAALTTYKENIPKFKKWYKNLSISRES